MRDREAAARPPARFRVRARTIAWSLLAGAVLGGVIALALAPPRGARFEARAPWAVAAPEAADWPRPARAGEGLRLEPGRRDRKSVV